eukprot:107805_1
MKVLFILSLAFIICIGGRVNTQYHRDRQLVPILVKNVAPEYTFDYDEEFEAKKRRQLLFLDDAVKQIADAVAGALEGPLKPIKDGIANVVEEIPFINQIPAVLAQVNNIPAIVKEIPKLLNYVQDIPSLLTKVLDIKKFAESIPKILEAIVEFLKNPFSFGNVIDEVTEFAETLEQCFTTMTGLVNPAQAFNDLFEFIDFSDLFDLPDPNQVLYKTMAFILLPFKGLITFVCQDSLPLAIDIAKNVFTGDFRRRRRRLNEDDINLKFNVSNRRRILNEDGTYATISTCQECARWEEEKRTSLVNEFVNENPHSTEEERREVYYNTLSEPNDSCNEYYVDGNINMKKTLCNSESTAWLYDINEATHYRDVTDWFSAELITNPYDTSYTESFIRIKIGLTVIEIIADIADSGCEMLDACQPDGAPGSCTFANICGIFEILLGVTANTMGFVLDIAEIHDGEINNVKIDRIFKDRFGIIHNQKVMMDNINEKFETELNSLLNGLLGISTSTETSSHISRYNIKAVINKMDNENYGLAAIKDTVDKIDNEQPALETIQNVVDKIQQLENDQEEFGFQSIENTLDDIMNDEFGLSAIKTVVDAINEKISIDEANTVAKTVHDDETIITTIDNEVIVFEIKTSDLYIGVAVVTVSFILIIGIVICLSVMITIKCYDRYHNKYKYKYKTVKYNDSETDINK